jgi:hypothetical protein
MTCDHYWREPFINCDTEPYIIVWDCWRCFRIEGGRYTGKLGCRPCYEAWTVQELRDLVVAGEVMGS